MDLEIGEIHLVRGPGRFFNEPIPDGMSLAYVVVRFLGQFQTVTRLLSTASVDLAKYDWRAGLRQMIGLSFADRLQPRTPHLRR